MGDSLIKIRGVKKSFNKPVLHNINLDINRDSFVSIVGESGSGKSTLLNILGLIENYDDGEYYFDNIKIDHKKDYAHIRLRDIGFIFQNYNLIGKLTAKENILLPTLYSNKDIDLNELVSILNIEDLLDEKVSVLSGGEKQRVAIARAMLLNPKVILADEPTGNLDEYNKRIVMNLLKYFNEKGCAVIIITHDYSVAEQTNRVYALKRGELTD